MPGSAFGRTGPRNSGPAFHSTLRKVVGTVFIDGHTFEQLECGHEGRPVDLRRAASKRWCPHCGGKVSR